MKRITCLLAAAMLCLMGSLPALRAAEDPAHAELRALRTQILEAITKGDFETVVKHVHPNVVVTWQNAEVCRGVRGLREFFERMGRTSFRGYKVPPTPDDLTILYGGDTGVSCGRVVASYTLLGKEYEFNSRWTATLVKENGQWMLASYHVSLNALDNPILNAAKRSVAWGAATAAAAGLLIGWLVGRRGKTA